MPLNPTVEKVPSFTCPLQSISMASSTSNVRTGSIRVALMHASNTASFYEEKCVDTDSISNSIFFDCNDTLRIFLRCGRVSHVFISLSNKYTTKSIDASTAQVVASSCGSPVADAPGDIEIVGSVCWFIIWFSIGCTTDRISIDRSSCRFIARGFPVADAPDDIETVGASPST
jgi:hypothetical protein